MSELIGKLTNLSYEFFGVLLPGIATSFLLLLCAAALGPCVPQWTGGALPPITITGARLAVDGAGVNDVTGMLVPAGAVWYFLGHILGDSRRATSFTGRCLATRS